jgi:hypothetical protein
MLSISCLLAVAVLIMVLVHAMGKMVLWPAVLLVSIIELLRCLPLR